MLELECIFDDYRKGHLEPLTQLTLKLQSLLEEHTEDYYIAQRLKRKPQILRKLTRFSVRLSQLQDIGGSRIIVNSNNDVDKFFIFLKQKLIETKFAKILRTTDYREKGRDDTGYRAFHVILEIYKMMLELQLRSRIQHYWSESIERTSVIYGYRLKEKDGHDDVLEYFKFFSDALHEIETRKNLSPREEIKLQESREKAENIIYNSTYSGALSGHVNQNVIKTMSEIEKNHPGNFNNWIFVFDWIDGNFLTWHMVSREADIAVKEYLNYESLYKETDKKEVVMIGTSSIATVQHTHSHYFGIEHHNNALESMEKSIIGLTRRSKIDIGARRILMTLRNRTFWGEKKVSLQR